MIACMVERSASVSFVDFGGVVSGNADGAFVDGSGVGDVGAF